jgi:pimeloyl-ACP methyl ester carboxylesterase
MPEPAPPVLLLHGFAGSFERTWRDHGWVDLLEDAGRTVIGLDLLGHGGHDKPHDPEAYTDLAGDVAARLPDGPLDGIGFSLGARTLLLLAAARPERFRRLVVAGVGANLFRAEDPERIAAGLEGPVGEEDRLAQHFAQLGGDPENDPAALVACLRRPEGPLRAEDLAPITAPVLVVLGDQDFAGPADPLLDAVADTRLVTLRNVDHFATPKDFGFIDAALGFLA